MSCNFFEFITLTCFFFLWILYNFLCIRSYHLSIDIIFHPSQFAIVLFPCLISLTRTSSTMLSTSDKSRHTYLVLDLRGKTFSLSPLGMLDKGFSYMAFIRLKRFHSLPRSLNVFIRMLGFCQVLFSASTEIIM